MVDNGSFDEDGAMVFALTVVEFLHGEQLGVGRLCAAEQLRAETISSEECADRRDEKPYRVDRGVRLARVLQSRGNTIKGVADPIPDVYCSSVARIRGI